MYSPVICAALLVVAPPARAGSRKTRRETRNTFRNFIAVPPQEDRRYSPTPPRAFQDFPSGDSTSSNEGDLCVLCVAVSTLAAPPSAGARTPLPAWHSVYSPFCGAARLGNRKRAIHGRGSRDGAQS